MNKQANTSFGAGSKAITNWTALAACGGAFFVLTLVIGHGTPGGTTIFAVGVLMAVWLRRASLVRLFDDHLEMRFAPLASTRRIRYRDIRGVELSKKNVAELALHENGKDASVKIPLAALNADDAESLLQVLTAKAAA